MFLWFIITNALANTGLTEDIDIRFDPTAGLNISSEKDRHIEARFRFYNDLAQKIRIPGIEVKRDVAFDDSKARNAGISLNYPSYFSPIEGQQTSLPKNSAHVLKTDTEKGKAR